MTIAIIGTGNMGAGIARLLASKGVKVAIGSRDPAKAAKLASEIGAGAEGGGIAAATKLADVVVLAVPFTAAAETIRDAGGFAGKVLVDISNPITPDYKALTVGHTTSAAEEIQKLAPQAKVVKAYNTDLRPAPSCRGSQGPHRAGFRCWRRRGRQESCL